ncbi:Protein of unknown function [Lentibacillus halodurans]|uniref:DUF3219 domain-containing protein n=1 Tax=Lentibacillus halodurans TaxID=237679 RepID=A0A1I0Y1H3_9BACI|nr:DUF3219 family protein [Lentibacillus halodurans]SFB07024.1 Protein of unknown function [Lentibacillus halodurans]
MHQKIIINDMEIDALNIKLGSTTKNGEERTKISFDFKVTHEAYHDITTLLYKNDFIVKVPDRHLQFPAVISNYSTSITNLYEEGAIGDFKLELIEKSSCH